MAHSIAGLMSFAGDMFELAQGLHEGFVEWRQKRAERRAGKREGKRGVRMKLGLQFEGMRAGFVASPRPDNENDPSPDSAPVRRVS